MRLFGRGWRRAARTPGGDAVAAHAAPGAPAAAAQARGTGVGQGGWGRKPKLKGGGGGGYRQGAPPFSNLTDFFTSLLPHSPANPRHPPRARPCPLTQHMGQWVHGSHTPIIHSVNLNNACPPRPAPPVFTAPLRTYHSPASPAPPPVVKFQQLFFPVLPVVPQIKKNEAGAARDHRVVHPPL